ncbi:MAG: DUF4249 domain-containing protein [Bacteroidales bacterium]|nr:DUF4249 domain-containing protein [Bacteroidales bacterium]
MSNFKLNKILLFLLSVFLMNSCEDVIDVKLNNIEPQIVIEATLYNQLQPATVIITKTTNFFDTLTLNTVSGAEVLISDNKGNNVTVEETDSAGIYQANYFGKTGTTYTLTVKTEGKIYTAQAEMKPPIKIDSLTSKFRTNPLPFQQEGYEITCYINDSINYNEYAKLDIYKNQRRSHEIYLFEDTYTDGNQYEYKFYNETFQVGDTAVALVLSCDKDVYEYLYTYAEITSDTFRDSGTPYNPTSNISNGALGYFGVFSLTGSFLIVK